MKWFVIVLFYTLHGDMYVFTEPTFDSREQCVASIIDPLEMPKYVQKLVLEYGRLLPIQALNCIDEETLKQIMEELVGEQA